MKKISIIFLLLVSCGTVSSTGEQGLPGITGATGTNGDTGKSCTVEQLTNGLRIDCPDGSNAVVLNCEETNHGKRKHRN